MYSSAFILTPAFSDAQFLIDFWNKKYVLHPDINRLVTRRSNPIRLLVGVSECSAPTATKALTPVTNDPPEIAI